MENIEINTTDNNSDYRDKKNKNPKFKNTAMYVVRPAIIAALLITVQLALRVIPNVELVTVLIIVCAFTFPPSDSLSATFVFCSAQWLIYGFGYWVAAYYIYWPLLATVAMLLKLIKKQLLRMIIAVVMAVFMTALFGIITSFFDVALSLGFTTQFFTYFGIVYIRGIYFYITHIISNAIIVGVLFVPLVLALKRVVKSNIT